MSISTLQQNYLAPDLDLNKVTISHRKNSRKVYTLSELLAKFGKPIALYLNLECLAFDNLQDFQRSYIGCFPSVIDCIKAQFPELNPSTNFDMLASQWKLCGFLRVSEQEPEGFYIFYGAVIEPVFD